MGDLLNTTAVDGDSRILGNHSWSSDPASGSGDHLTFTVLVGIVLALVAQFFTGISVAIRKKGLSDVALSGARPAGEGGFAYLKSRMWWLGFVILGVMQVTYGLCLSLAPAIVIAPLSVLSIAGSAIGGRIILKDWIGPFGWMGCVLVMSNCAIFAVAAPKEIDLANAEEVKVLFTSANFISFVGAIVIVDVALMFAASKYGSKHIILYSFIVGSSASVGIWLSKGIIVCLTEGAFDEWILWVTLVCQVLLTLYHMYYMHVLIDIFVASHASATHYVVFSILVIMSSSVVFPIRTVFTIKQGFLLGLSFIGIVVSLFILNVGKYIQFDFSVLVKENKDELRANSDAIAES